MTAGATAGLTTGLLLARNVLGEDAPTPVAMHEWHAMSVDEVREQLPVPKRDPAQQKSRLTVGVSASADVVQQVTGPALRLARSSPPPCVASFRIR